VPLTAIEVEGLRFSYGKETVLSVDAFRLDESETCALVGPSGCGKSTFVHLLAGLLTTRAGTVKVLGQDLAAFSESARDRFRGRHLGFVFQRLHLMPSLSVRENLYLAQRLSRESSGGVDIRELLERLGLGAFQDRRPNSLSQGQAQRVAIARALVHRPEIVIADEPTSALDDAHASAALDLLCEMTRESGAALLVVTHDQRVRGHLDRDFELGAVA
jgi:putative ABC transport system ATP-binding protein